MPILTPLSRRIETYSDLYKDMAVSEVNSDLLRSIDEQSIKEAIRNLILTDRGERLFQPEIGSDVRKMLFENITPETVVIVKDYIQMTIKNFEPRANVLGVDILSGLDSNEVSIVVTFSTINREEPIVLTITLDRVR